MGVFGSGFVIGLKNKYPNVEEMYKKWYDTYCLGEVQYVRACDNVIVANMFAQDGIGGMSKGHYNKVVKPIKYKSLVYCMDDLKLVCPDYEIVAPKFGSLRSGGTWSFIEELIEEIWGDFNVTIYEYKE